METHVIQIVHLGNGLMEYLVNLVMQIVKNAQVQLLLALLVLEVPQFLMFQPVWHLVL
jgi:hypothetical protein